MKTNQFKIYGILAGVCLMLSSCWLIGPSISGNGNVTEEVRNLEGFDEIEVSRGMNVYITQGSPAKVVVIADSNLHDVIETDVDGDVLKVSVNTNIRSAEEKKVMITVEKLTHIKSYSGANIYSQNQLMSEDLELLASAGSNITLEINAGRLRAKCSAGSNLHLSGIAKESDLEVNSGANLKAEELKSVRCRMRASSGGNVYASVEEELDAEASSGGNIFYYGQPPSTEINSSSGGNVNHR